MNNETKHEMQVFNNPLFGEVRTFMIDETPWFVAVDVCNALDIGNSRQAVSRLDEDERNTVIINDGTSGNPIKTIINESGLYALMLTSRKAEAKQFKRWIIWFTEDCWMCVQMPQRGRRKAQSSRERTGATAQNQTAESQWDSGETSSGLAF